jgi:hypothetical protein
MALRHRRSAGVERVCRRLPLRRRRAQHQGRASPARPRDRRGPAYRLGRPPTIQARRPVQTALDGSSRSAAQSLTTTTPTRTLAAAAMNTTGSSTPDEREDDKRHGCSDPRSQHTCRDTLGPGRLCGGDEGEVDGGAACERPANPSTKSSGRRLLDCQGDARTDRRQCQQQWYMRVHEDDDRRRGGPQRDLAATSEIDPPDGRGNEESQHGDHRREGPLRVRSSQSSDDNRLAEDDDRE